jgi:hypothetical protein
MILKWIFESGIGDMGWIDVVQDRDSWWAVVNEAMNIRVS